MPKKTEQQWLEESSSDEENDYEESVAADEEDDSEAGDDMEDEGEEEDDERLQMFSEVKRKYRGKPHLKAALEAFVTVIKSQGVEPSPVAFFGVCISYFGTTGVTEKEPDEIGCVLALFEVILQHVPKAILIAKFSMIAPTFLSIYETFATSALIVKNLATCVYVVLAPQPPSVWSNADGRSSFQLLLSLTVDSREKVRKTAQRKLVQIYSECDPAVHKAISASVQHFTNKILSQAHVQAPTVTIHILRVLKHTLPLFPTNKITQIFEVILRLPTVSHTGITSSAFSCLAASFAAEKSNITLEQVKAVLEVLSGLRPNIAEEYTVIAYVDLLGQIYKKLYSMDTALCTSKLPEAFQTLLSFLASEKPSVSQAVQYALQVLVRQCISNDMISNAISSPTSPLRDIIGFAEQSLSAQYQHSLDVVLLFIASLFERLDVNSGILLKELLLTISDFQSTAAQTPHLLNPLNAVFGFAISSMGPRKFLEILPLNLDRPIREKPEFGDPFPNRSWLLPVLRDNMEYGELKFFADYFIPLASQIMQEAVQTEEKGRLIEAKNKQIIHDQIWDLFPAFCNKPIDLAQSFKVLAKTIGTNLSDVPQLRLVMMSGLRTLIESTREVMKSNDDADNNNNNNDDTNIKPKPKLTPEAAEAGIKSMASFSKNFLPILFNLFSGSESGNSGPIFDTVEAYVSITDANLLNNFFKNVMTKLLEATTVKDENEGEEEKKKSREQSYMLTDLSSAFVKSLDMKNLEFLFKVIKPNLKSADRSLQKKSYKALSYILAFQPYYAKQHHQEIENTIFEATSQCLVPSKKSRLRIIKDLLTASKSETDTLGSQYMAEIILGVKELNKKAKKAAFEVLVEVAKYYMEKDPVNGIKTVFTQVAAGLAGTTPFMTSATVFSLARLLFEYKDLLEDSFMGDMVGAVIVLLQSPEHEVVRSTLGFLKVSIASVPPAQLELHLKTITSSLYDWMTNHKNKFRMLVKDIIIRLFKKFGFTKIYNTMPQPIRPYINSVYKKEVKVKTKKKAEKEKGEKRNKRNKKEEEDVSSDEDELWDALEDKIKAPKTDEAFMRLTEGDDDDGVIDLLDPRSTMKNIVSTKPKAKSGGTQSKAKEDYFKRLADGRFVFDERMRDDDEEGGGKKLSRKQKALIRSNERLPIDPSLVMEEEAAFDKKIKKAGEKNLSKEDYLDEVMNLDGDVEEGQKPKPNNNYENSKYAERNKRKRKQENNNNNDFGKKFKAVKAGGDIKKGSTDPYAYVPLDGRLLNKRKKQKALGDLRQVVTKKKEKKRK